jgi:hypothetical protein
MIQAQVQMMKLQGEAAEKYKAKVQTRTAIIASSAKRLWERQQVLQYLDEM